MTQESIADALARAAAAEATYRCRPSSASAEVSWQLTADALVREGAPARRIPYTDIRRIRLFGSPGLAYSGREVAPASGICRVKVKSGRNIGLTSSHVLGLGRSEDRSASFQPFVERLVQNTQQANPGVIVLNGMPLAVWALWAAVLAGTAAFVVFAAVMAADAAAAIAAALWAGDHRQLKLDTFVTGGLALVMALALGVSVPVLVRTLWRERPRRIETNGRWHISQLVECTSKPQEK